MEIVLLIITNIKAMKVIFLIVTVFIIISGSIGYIAGRVSGISQCHNDVQKAFEEYEYFYDELDEIWEEEYYGPDSLEI